MSRVVASLPEMEGTVQATESTATPEALFAAASDVAAYPDWASGVKDVEILDTDTEGRATRARFVIEAMIRRITYVLEYRYVYPNKISWSAEPGDDITSMEGSYTFEPLEDGGSEIVYALAVDPAFKVPGFLRSQAERTIVNTALRDLRRQAESG
jgi:ribosome-associated toxin RatA of RatAB toxin-antitoxin module